MGSAHLTCLRCGAHRPASALRKQPARSALVVADHGVVLSGSRLGRGALEGVMPRGSPHADQSRVRSGMDSQSVEIIGRNYLVSQLVGDGLEVARPERDRGVDLIAYLDLDETGGPFVACPIQMKAASNRSFSLERKYAKFSHLLLAYVWQVHEPNEARAYALTYAQALAVAEEMRWTKTASWREHDSYSTTRPPKRLLTALESYLMSTGDWKRKVQEEGTGVLSQERDYFRRGVQPARVAGPIVNSETDSSREPQLVRAGLRLQADRTPRGPVPIVPCH